MTKTFNVEKTEAFDQKKFAEGENSVHVRANTNMS